MIQVNKSGILYRGVRRGRRKLLAICLVLAAITVWYTAVHMVTLKGKFHGPYPFDEPHFAASTQTETFSKPIKMKKREDRSISSYAYMDTSYTKGDQYRFTLQLDNITPTDIHYDAEYENPQTGETELVTIMRLYLADIGGKQVPVMAQANRTLAAGDMVTGIFVKPDKVVRADLSATVPEGETLTVSEYMLDTRGIEMNTENSDPWIIGILLAITLFLAIRVAVYYINPLRHPTYTQLQKYGDISEIITSVETQAESDAAYKEDKSLIMPDWICYDATFKRVVVKNHMASGRYE
ncbi:MAG: hypothetical protein E7409_04305 [Ruminococcaceae bacterium]|nr:hypothetical protein [Oscillospiraceae bacterium]